MSRKMMKEQAAALQDAIPAELGPALKMLGDVLQSEWMDRNGLYLDADARKERGKNPLACVDDTFIQVRVGDLILKLEPSDTEKPAVSIPVGLSDKKNTATIPRDWLLGCWVDALICVFDGDASIAQDFANRVNEAIDAASDMNEETERLSIKQPRLPSHRNSVEVAEIVESLKRHFHGKSAGSPRVNMTFSISHAGDAAQAATPVEDALTTETLAARVDDALVPNPTAEVVSDEAADTPPTDAEPKVEQAPNGPAPEPSVGHPIPDDGSGQPAVEEATSDVEGDGPLDVEPETEEEDPALVVLRALDEIGEPATWGALKKQDPAVEAHRKVLDTLINLGFIHKEGERRGTRYSITGGGLEYLVGMPLPDVISQDLENEPLTRKPPDETTTTVAVAVQHEDGSLRPVEPDDPLNENVVDESGFSMAEVIEQVVNPPDQCYLCENPSVFVYEDLPTGPKQFCSEKCLCEYDGREYHGEGHYGITEPVSDTDSALNTPTGEWA